MDEAAQDHDGAPDQEQVGGEVPQRDGLDRRVVRQRADERLRQRPALAARAAQSQKASRSSTLDILGAVQVSLR